jgi:hypothetical protein
VGFPRPQGNGADAQVGSVSRGGEAFHLGDLGDHHLRCPEESASILLLA